MLPESCHTLGSPLEVLLRNLRWVYPLFIVSLRRSFSSMNLSFGVSHIFLVRAPETEQPCTVSVMKKNTKLNSTTTIII
jgi:hypothetical protein